MRRLLALVVATVVAWAPVAATGLGPSLDYVDVFRNRGEVWLLDGVRHELHRQGGGERPAKVFDLLDGSGKPRTWPRPSTGFTSFQADWLVVDGSDLLLRFSSTGRLKSSQTLPAPAWIIVSSGAQLFTYDVRPSSRGQRLWKSKDGRHFDPVGPRELETSGGQGILSAQRILAGGAGGDLFIAPVIGPPKLWRLGRSGAVSRVPLAYSRTARRSTLDGSVEDEYDLTQYSAPVADILIREDEEIVVLRNREDVRDRQGHVEVQERRRADRYSAGGKHLASVEFPESAGFLLRDEGGSLTALTRSGAIMTAAYSRPALGGILP
jgi:hypothetical protein